NNLQAAADLTYFSSITHCTTLMTLAPYFRRHPRIGLTRLILVLSTFILWAHLAVVSLEPISDKTHQFAFQQLTFHQNLFNMQFAFGIIQFSGLLWMSI